MRDRIDRRERRKIIGEYVRERLVVEVGQSRGNALKIAKHTGFSAAHVSNIKDGHRNVGDTFAMTMADYWGMTYSQLERLALERLAVAYRRRDMPAPFAAPASQVEEPADRLPQLAAVLGGCDEQFYPKSFLQEYERVARKATRDRPKAVWLADLEVKYWDWRQRRIHAKTAASLVDSESHLSRELAPAAADPRERDVEPSTQVPHSDTTSRSQNVQARTRARAKPSGHEGRLPRRRRG